jgi:hypothetical protein
LSRKDLEEKNTKERIILLNKLFLGDREHEEFLLLFYNSWQGDLRTLTPDEIPTTSKAIKQFKLLIFFRSI